MIYKIPCMQYRTNLLNDLQTTLQTIRNSHPQLKVVPFLAIIAIEPSEDDQAYMDSIVSLFSKFDIPVEITKIPTNYTAKMMDVVGRYTNEHTPMLVMCPANKHPMYSYIIELIPNYLDVDGITSQSKIAWRNNVFYNNIPATTLAVLQIVKTIYFHEDFKRCHAVVIGRGPVGKSIADGLLNRNMAVTTVHSRTPDYLRRRLCDDANLIISAVGKPHIFNYDEFMGGTGDKLVIDVGVSFDDNGNMCGDIYYPDNFADLVENDFKTESRVYNYTTVRGGVGCMTSACLLTNVLNQTFTEVGIHDFQKYAYMYGD